MNHSGLQQRLSSSPRATACGGSASTSQSPPASTSWTASRLSRRLIYLAILTLYCGHLVAFTSATAFISGSTIKCLNEGENVSVSFIYEDPCISCKCQNQEIVCERDTCLQNRKCTHNGKSYRSGESWKNGTCNRCSCTNGAVACQAEVCERDLVCSEKQRKQHLNGDCCPSCIENDGVCTLRGSGHSEPFLLKSFDDKSVPFSGRCNYALVRNCEDKSFFVHILRNVLSTAAANGSDSALSIVVKYERTKVRVTKRNQEWHLQVGRRAEKLPFLRLGVMSVLIAPDDAGIIVRTNIGVKVNWNGDDVVSVSVPSKYKSKVCGLCGNYNGNAEDDILTKKGRAVATLDHFFNSWKVGKVGACARPQKRKIEPSRAKDHCTSNLEKRVEAMNICNVLKVPQLKSCHRLVSIVPYYKSCIKDMCACETEKCHCRAIQSYVFQCQRIGLKIDSWTAAANCDGVTLSDQSSRIKCPPGSIFSPCASACKRNCRNFRRKNRVCNKECAPGCDCPGSTVWHKDRCIPPRSCPPPIKESSSVYLNQTKT